MKTFVINLERSSERKIYMHKLLNNFPFLDYEFVSAVDGRNMDIAERNEKFDLEKFRKRYGFDVRPGEIGCTLSHQKCYRKIVKERIPYVLILEDDANIPINISEILNSVENLVNVKKPRVVLLTGYYWFTQSHSLISGYEIVDIYDAFSTQAYLINLAAAELLIENKPFITADDWRYLRKKGILLQAVHPHVVGSYTKLSTTIDIEKRDAVGIWWKCCHFRRLFIMKMLKILGHFEHP